MKFMKFTLLAFLLTTCLHSIAQGPIAHWNFNGNANDITGNGHNGVANNVTLAPGKAGVANTAYYFNGTSSYIGAPYMSDLNLSQFSICAIVKPMSYYSGLCEGNIIVTRGHDNNTGNYALVFSDAPYNTCGIQDTTLNVFYATSGSTWGNNTQWQSSSKVLTNTWYKVVLTFDGSTFKTYVNDTNTSTYIIGGGSIGTSTDSLWIGGHYGDMSYPYWLNGYLDDLKIYNRVLADSEITAHGSNIILSAFATTLCTDRTFNLPYVIDGTIHSGNVFTVQLSSATGSFASPTVIGTASGTASGSISCTIPSSVTPGAGYKIRVVSSNPAIISDEVAVTVNSSATPSVALAATPSVSLGKSATVGMGSSITFKATAVNSAAATYTWYKNRMPIAGAPNTDTYTAIAGVNFMNNDTISVKMKTNHTCATPDSAMDFLQMIVNVGISDISRQMNIGLYPNPNNGSFSIKGYVPVNGNLQVTVYNTIGQVIYSKQVAVTTHELNETILLNNAAPGIYQVKIGNEACSKTMRVTVQ